MRFVYLLGSMYIGFSALVLMWPSPVASSHGHPRPAVVSHPTPAVVTKLPDTAGQWFRTIKPYCNSVEVETQHRRMPPPQTFEGTGYSAACYALAGKIEKARAAILALPRAQQWEAVGIVFNVAHPVADAGDDLSAGPIMELVVDFWPNHYMALYHAGISNHELGQPQRARRYLNNFLKHYDRNDVWRERAEAVLSELD